MTGDAFIDVGANVGYHALLAASQLAGAGRVAAIEASPTIYQCLQGNLALNGDTGGVRAVNMAASDVPGTVHIHRGPAARRRISTHNRPARSLAHSSRSANTSPATLLRRWPASTVWMGSRVRSARGAM